MNDRKRTDTRAEAKGSQRETWNPSTKSPIDERAPCNSYENRREGADFGRRITDGYKFKVGDKREVEANVRDCETSTDFSKFPANRKRRRQNPDNQEEDGKNRSAGYNHALKPNDDSNAKMKSEDILSYVRNDGNEKNSHKKRLSRRRRRRHQRNNVSRKESSSSSSLSRTNSVVSEDEEPDFRKVVSEDEETDFRKVKCRQEYSEYHIRSKTKRKASGSASSWDDTVGHFRGTCGSTIADRYRIIEEVGIGTFGRVLECADLNRRASDKNRYGAAQYVAIKVVRSVKRYCDSAIIEAKIVADLNRCGGRGLSHCVVLRDSFSLDGHYCLVFERLGPSLYDFLKRHNYQPFPMVCVQDFTVQLLEALEFMHSLRLIHTDLKIENILLMDHREVNYGTYRVPASTKIKVIDFGGACYDSDKKSTIITTRQYRAPEVILGTGWSMPSDMWSTGCILAELYQGELLFATKDNVEHLALMEQALGYFPRHMIKEARNNPQNEVTRQAFNSSGLHRMERALDPDKFSFVRRMPRLEQIVRNSRDEWFLGLLKKTLDLDPKQRATAHECLRYLTRQRKNVVLYN